MGEGWESTGTQSMQLVFKEGYLLGLLLNNVSKLENLGGVLDFLLGIVGIVLVLAGLELQDLFTLADGGLQLAGLLLELSVFGLLLLNLVSKLLLGLVDSFNTFGTGALKLSGLVFKAFLVVFVLFDMLTLDNLLSLLGNTVELHILGALDEVSNFQS